MNVPKQHKAAYLMGPGIVDIRTVGTPAPGPGELLLRVDCALAGGTDRKAYVRGHPFIPMPGPFGHRYAGTVAAVGDGGAFQVGQPVMGVHSAPCWQCDLCRKGRHNLCPDVMKEKVLGSFAEYLCIPAPIVRCNVFERPTHLGAEYAAFLEPLACVVHGLEMLDFRGVERIAVVGLGAMGLLFAQLLPRYSNAVILGSAHRHFDLAQRLGVTTVYDTSATPLAQQVDANEKFDCVIECTGKPDGWQDAVACAGPGAQVLLFGGLPLGTEFVVDSYQLHYEDLRLIGCFHFSPSDVAKAREFLVGFPLELDALIADRLNLAQLPEAMQRLANGIGMQYAIMPHV